MPSEAVRLAAHGALIQADAVLGKERRDPDPQTTKVVKTCLSELAKGVKESSVMTPQMLNDFAPRQRAVAAGWLDDLRSLTFVMRDDVQGRGIERRGAEVSHVCHYKMVAGQTTIYLTFHLTPEGKVADLFYRSD
jgi:hypothetical protein